MAVQAPHLQEHPPAVILGQYSGWGPYSGAGRSPAQPTFPSGPRPSPGYGQLQTLRGAALRHDSRQRNVALPTLVTQPIFALILASLLSDFIQNDT